MKAGTTLVFPEGSGLAKSIAPTGRVYDVPSPTRNIFYGKSPDEVMTFNESFQLAVPADKPLVSGEGGTGWVLPEDAVRLVPGSSWGTFTIACTVPIALAVGWYMYRFRKGKVVEASVLGRDRGSEPRLPGRSSPARRSERFFLLSREQTILAMAAYGFIASILPVWPLLCPRDYLSSFLKIGTIGLLVSA